MPQAEDDPWPWPGTLCLIWFSRPWWFSTDGVSLRAGRQFERRGLYRRQPSLYKCFEIGEFPRCSETPEFGSKVRSVTFGCTPQKQHRLKKVASVRIFSDILTPSLLLFLVEHPWPITTKTSQNANGFLDIWLFFFLSDVTNLKEKKKSSVKSKM